MLKSDREYRNMPIEVRVDGEQEDAMMVRGYAATFNEPYVLYEDEDWKLEEVIAPDAFDNTDMEDVIMQYDHEGRVFARRSNNTLEVGVDEKGLLINADLGGTEIGRQLYEEIRGGYTDKMSFGFVVEQADFLDTEDESGKSLTIRTINAIRKLYDVSAVSIPANDATSISVRKLADGEINRLKAERLAEEKLKLERRRAEVKARAIGR